VKYSFSVKYMLMLALVAGFMLLSAPVSAGDGTCASIKDFETKVNVNLVLADPYIDLSKTKKQINRERDGGTEQWLQRNNMQELWKADDMSVGGYASGASAYSLSVRSTYRPVDQYWVYYCIYFAEINVDVFYRTQIVIPSDTPRDSCEFEVVYNHEMRHHEANESAYKEFIDRLDKDILEIVYVLEDEYISKEGVDKHTEFIKNGLEDMLDVYVFKSTMDKMRLLNGQIDSPEEYGSHHEQVAACVERRKLEGPQVQQVKKQDGMAPPR